MTKTDTTGPAVTASSLTSPTATARTGGPAPSTAAPVPPPQQSISPTARTAAASGGGAPARLVEASFNVSIAQSVNNPRSLASLAAAAGAPPPAGVTSSLQLSSNEPFGALKGAADPDDPAFDEPMPDAATAAAEESVRYSMSFDADESRPVAAPAPVSSAAAGGGGGAGATPQHEPKKKSAYAINLSSLELDKTENRMRLNLDARAKPLSPTTAVDDKTQVMRPGADDDSDEFSQSYEITRSGTYRRGDFALSKAGIKSTTATPARSGQTSLSTTRTLTAVGSISVLDAATATGSGSGSGTERTEKDAKSSLSSTLSSHSRSDSLQQALSLDSSGVVITGVLGRGSSAVVYKCYELRTMRWLALKSISIHEQEKRKQLTKELTVFTSPAGQSPFLIEFAGAYFDEGRIFLGLEWMDAGSLQDLVDRTDRSDARARSTSPATTDWVVLGGGNGSQPTAAAAASAGGGGAGALLASGARVLPEVVIAYIFERVLRGLHHLHAHKQIHRDIKPHNILMNRRGEIKLTDFGILSELAHPSSSATGNTATGSGGGGGSSDGPHASTFIGTVLYMDPQRISGEKYSFGADVWSMGMSVMSVALGRYAVPHTGHYQLLNRLMQDGLEQYLTPTELFSTELRNFVTVCVAKDATKRPSALQLLSHPFFAQYRTVKPTPNAPPPANADSIPLIPIPNELTAILNRIGTADTPSPTSSASAAAAAAAVSPNSQRTATRQPVVWSSAKERRTPTPKAGGNTTATTGTATAASPAPVSSAAADDFEFVYDESTFDEAEFERHTARNKQNASIQLNPTAVAAAGGLKLVRTLSNSSADSNASGISTKPARESDSERAARERDKSNRQILTALRSYRSGHGMSDLLTSDDVSRLSSTLNLLRSEVESIYASTAAAAAGGSGGSAASH